MLFTEIRIPKTRLGSEGKKLALAEKAGSICAYYSYSMAKQLRKGVGNTERRTQRRISLPEPSIEAEELLYQIYQMNVGQGVDVRNYDEGVKRVLLETRLVAGEVLDDQLQRASLFVSPIRRTRLFEQFRPLLAEAIQSQRQTERDPLHVDSRPISEIVHCEMPGGFNFGDSAKVTALYPGEDPTKQD